MDKLTINRIRNHTIEEIQEEYIKLIHEYQRKYFNQIIDVIQSEIRGIRESKMEEWIQEYLINDIRSKGHHQIDKITAHIEPSLDRIANSINNGQNVNREFKQYLEELVNVTRRINTEWLETLSSEFIKQIKIKIENYYDVFYGIDNNRFYRSLDEIEYNLKSTIKRINNQFEEEYKNIYKVAFKTQMNKIKNSIDSAEKQQESISQEHLNQASKMLMYNNYRLIQQDGKLYAKHNETEEVIELIYDKNNHMLLTKDQNMGIRITDKGTVSVNKKADSILIYTGFGLEVSNLKGSNIIKVTPGFIGYQFYQNNQEVTDLKAIEEITSIIKSKSPGYYIELIKDPEFKEVLEKIALEKMKGTKEYDEYTEIMQAIDGIRPISKDNTSSYEVTPRGKTSR